MLGIGVIHRVLRNKDRLADVDSERVVHEVVSAAPAPYKMNKLTTEKDRDLTHCILVAGLVQCLSLPGESALRCR